MVSIDVQGTELILIYFFVKYVDILFKVIVFLELWSEKQEYCYYLKQKVV